MIWKMTWSIYVLDISQVGRLYIFDDISQTCDINRRWAIDTETGDD